MGFGKRMVDPMVDDAVPDPTAWMIDNPVAEVFLLHDFGVKFMFMLGYTFYTGTTYLRLMLVEHRNERLLQQHLFFFVRTFCQNAFLVENEHILFFRIVNRISALQ